MSDDEIAGRVIAELCYTMDPNTERVVRDHVLGAARHFKAEALEPFVALAEEHRRDFSGPGVRCLCYGCEMIRAYQIEAGA